MYTDIKELYPGAAQSLQETLRLLATAVSEAASNQDNISTPSPAHFPLTQARQGFSILQNSPMTPLDPNFSNTQNTETAPENSIDTDTADVVKCYLLMCINTNKKEHLEQIEVTYAGNDQVLFQDIRQAYFNIRKSQNTGYYLTTPGPLASLFREFSFSRPKIANFVMVRISHTSEKRYYQD